MHEHPEFDIFGSLSLVTKDEGGETKRYFNTIASSTVEDSHGDEFTTAAVEKMAQTANSAPMTIFLNHEYRVPEDVFGTATSARTSDRSDAGVLVKDLDIAGMVNEANPRAKQTADLIQNGARLGVSIGARVKSYRPRDEKDPMGGWIIDDVELKEASIVGLPANPRTWVQYATKAIRRFERERVMEATDMTKKVAAAAAAAEETVDESITEDGEASIDLISKVFSTQTMPGVQAPEAVDGESEEGEPTFDGPDEEVPAEAETESAEPTPEGSPVPVTASETPVPTPTPEIDSTVESLTFATLQEALVIAKSELDSREASINQVTLERDAALAALATATAIVETIANKPLGRKATFQPEIDDYRVRIGGTYNEEFRKFLKGPQQ
jgi:HK97 family phage prohead protease